MNADWYWNFDGNINKYKLAIDYAIEQKETKLLAMYYKQEESFHPTWKILHKKIEINETLLGLVIMGNLE